MHTQPTYCRICEAACGLLADVEGERVVGLRPDPAHVVSRGFACAKGTRFLALHHSPDRVDFPLRREGSALRRLSWGAALGDVGGQLRRLRREHGPHSVALYVGNPAAFSYTLPLFGMGLHQALGTRNYFTAGSLDCNNKFVVARRMFGSPATQPVPDLDHARFALLLGTNPSVSQSSFVNAPRMVERLQGIVARGGRVVIVDPRRTETARSVGEHVPIVPDSDALLLLALLHVVFAERLERRDVISAYGNGIEELRAAAARFSPEAVAGATRIPADRIRELARAFAAAEGAFCHVSTGVNQGTFGAIAYAAKLALEFVTGNLDRRGGALVQRGAVDAARLAQLSRLDREPSWKSRVGGLPTVLGALPSAILPDEIEQPGDGQVRALIVIAGNPLLSMPDGDRLRRALARLELLVVVDLFVNDTAALATHVLPCTDFLEREDLPLAQVQLQPVPYLQWTDAVVPAAGERREEWRIQMDLAHAAGLPMFGSRAADLALRAALRLGGPKALVLPSLVAALGPNPLARLRAHPHGLLVDRERPGDFLAHRVLTPSKRVELHPRDVYARLDELARTLTPDGSVAAGDGLRLRLFTRRERLGHNSWMHANGSLELAEQRAWLSLEDAATLGLARGDRVRLSTERGAIELLAEATRDVVSGSVAVPHGYGHELASGWKAAQRRGGVNVNALAASGPASVDPLTGMTRFVGVPVRVERVAQVRATEPAAADVVAAE